jgi:hypothetical protein
MSLLLAIIPETHATSGAPDKELHPSTRTAKTPPAAPPRVETKRTSPPVKWEHAMSHFLEETNKILRASKQRHDREKIEEQRDHKEEILKKEIDTYEQKLSRIKESKTQEELFTHIKDWAESLPPCPIRLLNAMTMWRELVKKGLE